MSSVGGALLVSTFLLLQLAAVHSQTCPPCEHGGTCGNNSQCQCFAGYSGASCETLVDCWLAQTTVFEKTGDFINPCHNDGFCPLGEVACTCPDGFSGIDCAVNIDECASAPCQNGGSCEDGINTFTCHCIAGFTGTFCEENVNECLTAICQNGATCVDGINEYTCTCVAGFTGSDCSVDIDECASSPCQNGGICFDLLNAFQCDCPSGFSGSDCSWVCEADCEACEVTDSVDAPRCSVCKNSKYLKDGECVSSCGAGFISAPYTLDTKSVGHICAGMSVSPCCWPCILSPLGTHLLLPIILLHGSLRHRPSVC